MPNIAENFQTNKDTVTLSASHKHHTDIALTK